MISQHKEKAAESGRSGLHSKKNFYNVIIIHIFVNKTKEKRKEPKPDLFGLSAQF